LPEVSDLPNEYRLTVRNRDVKDKFIFEEDENGEAKGIVGTVNHDCSIEVKNIADPRYIRIQQERSMSQVIPAKRTQHMDDNARPLFIPPTHITQDNDFINKVSNIVKYFMSTS
jgi:hypothetical protein